MTPEQIIETILNALALGHGISCADAQWLFDHACQLRTEHDALKQQLEASQREAAMQEAILWALGENGEFALRPEKAGAYWWRTELRQRSNQNTVGAFVPRAVADALAKALMHQRNALITVRDRQHGQASLNDLTQGISQIDAALEEHRKATQ